MEYRFDILKTCTFNTARSWILVEIYLSHFHIEFFSESSPICLKENRYLDGVVIEIH